MEGWDTGLLVLVMRTPIAAIVGWGSFTFAKRDPRSTSWTKIIFASMALGVFNFDIELLMRESILSAVSWAMAIVGIPVCVGCTRAPCLEYAENADVSPGHKRPFEPHRLRSAEARIADLCPLPESSAVSTTGSQSMAAHVDQYTRRVTTGHNGEFLRFLPATSTHRYALTTNHSRRVYPKRPSSSSLLRLPQFLKDLTDRPLDLFEMPHGTLIVMTIQRIES
jgi:hypothetical protein